MLNRILQAKRHEVEEAITRIGVEELRQRRLWGQARRGFARAIESHSGRCIIAEIKQKSPSRGTIRRRFDPACHALEYQQGGATCLSVLTDQPFFGGSLDDLEAARRACQLPILRKDFLIDPYQLVEARAYGADAVLLIVAALAPAELVDLLHAAAEEELDVLVEVHDEREMGIAVESGATLLGINNRDLASLKTSTEVTRRLLALVPEQATVISESGLSEPAELAELERSGVAGFLIGEALMRAEQPGKALAALLAP